MKPLVTTMVPSCCATMACMPALPRCILVCRPPYAADIAARTPHCSNDGVVRTNAAKVRAARHVLNMHFPQAGYWLDVGDASTALDMMTPCTPRDACAGGPVV